MANDFHIFPIHVLFRLLHELHFLLLCLLVLAIFEVPDRLLHIDLEVLFVVLAKLLVLENEVASQSRPCSAASFVGSGTPSRIGHVQLELLVDVVREVHAYFGWYFAFLVFLLVAWRRSPGTCSPPPR